MLKRFRQILIAKHQSLVQAYHSTKGNTRNAVPDGTEDYIDYAVSSYDRDFSLSLTEMERGQMRLVEEALKRIDRGNFGSCLHCGQEIPEKRLEVEPWARHCIRCQELEERGLLEGPPLDDEDEEDSLQAAAKDQKGNEDGADRKTTPDASRGEAAGDDETEDELSV
jgi:DnaK suppressor protein